METKPLSAILKKIKNIELDEKFDLVIGIAKGGMAPANLVATQLNLPVDFISINFRDETNKPQGKSPKLIEPITFKFKNKNILLVDDRSNTGATFELAKEKLEGARKIKTLVVNGKADYSLFDEKCFEMPWNT